VRIKSVHVAKFKRFAQLDINDIPATARLVLLAGPNGFGKSSLFDAFFQGFGQLSGRGIHWDEHYHTRTGHVGRAPVLVQLHAPTSPVGGPHSAQLFYFRTAYRNDPDVIVQQLNRVGPATEERRFQRMNQNDVTVALNLQRMVGALVEDVSNREPGDTTFESYRSRLFGELDHALNTLFPDLRFTGFADPLQAATFYFTKGAAEHFRYVNLSAGEKAAFDLILDLFVKRREFYDSVYCIDEPELHLNPAIHGKLLDVILAVLPKNAQLWLATHSIGMMRRAIDIERSSPGSVVFFDFANQDFDQPVSLTPVKPTRTFWVESLQVALADLSELVAPKMIVVCEGDSAGKNADHDATCYNRIFSSEFPETQFISGGNSHDVKSDRYKFVAALPSIIKGVTMRKLIDRDDHSKREMEELRAKGLSVLGKRTIESYLWDDEVLIALCKSYNQDAAIADVLALKHDALQQLGSRGKPPDDMRSAAGAAYASIKTRLALTKVGNDSRAFERDTLAPLIQKGMAVYDDLKASIFF
jgi:predicted ATPase